jgi:hypothetical protein
MDGSQRRPRELSSWKEISTYFGVTVRTAQNWEVERGLPVRRLPGKRSTVSASAEELDAWRRTAGEAPGDSAPRSSNRWAYVTAFAFLAVVLGICAVVMFTGRQSPPASYRLDGNALVVLDARGQEAWRKVFDPPPNPGYYEGSFRKFWVGDLDNDGRVEVLFAYGSISSSALICFSDRGREKWRFIPGPKVATDTETYSGPFIVGNFAVAPWGNGGRSVVAVSCPHFEFPNQVALISPDGRIVGEYWHSGHLPEIAVLGRELWLGGINNAVKTATVVVLDASGVSGASVESDVRYQLRGFPPAKEKARIFFPRSCINRKHYGYNWVTQVASADDGMEVSVAEVPPPTPVAVWYTLSRDFAVRRVLLHDMFRSRHSEMRAAGLLDHDLTEREEAEMKAVRVIRPAALR